MYTHTRTHILCRLLNFQVKIAETENSVETTRFKYFLSRGNRSELIKIKKVGVSLRASQIYCIRL